MKNYTMKMKLLKRSGVDTKTRRKKICVVVTIAPTIKAFFIPQLKYLAQRGFDVTVVCSKDNTLQELLGCNIRYIPIEIPRGVSFLKTIRAMRDLLNLFRRERYDLVQYSTPNAAFCAAIAAKLSHIPVRNYHLMGFRYLGTSGKGRMILKMFEKISCFFSTSIECTSKSNLEMGIEEKIFPASKATVVWNGSTGGVDLKKFKFANREIWRKEIRDDLGLTQEDFVFGFVGRITRDKGINEIFEAFFKISNPNNKSKLVLIGSKEGVNTLDAKLLQKAYICKNIIFHESVTDIEKYYAAIDVLLLPSYREGFGNVIIEAAAVGTPAIVSDIPGPIDAIKKGETAVTVPVKDSEKLSKKMNDCIKSRIQFDSKKCETYVREHFDSELLCEKIFERKKKLLNL